MKKRNMFQRVIPANLIEDLHKQLANIFDERKQLEDLILVKSRDTGSI